MHGLGPYRRAPEGDFRCGEPKNCCVWVKDNGGMGSFYRSRHEFVHVFKKGRKHHRNNLELDRFGPNRSKVWTFPVANSQRKINIGDWDPGCTDETYGLGGAGHRMDCSGIDVTMMKRCIQLSRTAGEQGEFPFAALICKGADILVEATNESMLELDTTRHAELIALSRAQHRVRSEDLSGCTLYSNVEPCVMCSLSIRETRISRVVYGLESPLMGGHTKWPILRDADLSRKVPEGFGVPPEIVAGLLAKEAAEVWHQWNPLVWRIVQERGCFHTRPFHRWEPLFHPTSPLQRSLWKTWRWVQHRVAASKGAAARKSGAENPGG